MMLSWTRLFQITFVFIISITILHVFIFSTYFSTLDIKQKILPPEGLKIKGLNFTLKRKPFRILSGSLQYFRVHHKEWEDYLLKMKAMGLNAVEIYIPWNLHEPIPGEYDFDGQLSISNFLNLVQDYDLFAIVRPGPYICTEFDLGGLPSWLLKDKNMKLRSMYQPFIRAVDKYFQVLFPLLKTFQFSQGGPIIAFQIENEYGSHGTDATYMQHLKKSFESNGLRELFFVCDNEEGLGKYQLDGVLQTINFMSKNAGKFIDKLLKFQPDKPVFVMEFWVGWFSHWGEKFHKVSEKKLAETLEYVMNRGGSFNLYMWHGGTTFGFMNGANANDDGSNYQSDITSYDYDAPVSECGVIRSKYEKFKQVIRKCAPKGLLPRNLPWISDEKTFASYGDVEMLHYMVLKDLLFSKLMPVIQRVDVCSMESLPINNNSGQSYGYIVYETKIEKRNGKTINIRNARDFIVVTLNGVMIAQSKENSLQIHLEGFLQKQKENVLHILVENSGRVNYGHDINNQRKGILGKVLLDDSDIVNWNIYPLEFKSDWVNEKLVLSKAWKRFTKASSLQTYSPTVYKGNLFISNNTEIEDAFVKVSGWFKGVVFINGHNLGRYWKIGPQKTLYTPRHWLHLGNNSVVLFDLSGTPNNKDGRFIGPIITFTDKHNLGEKDAIEFLI